jgi:2-polyprenyl-3-methyl-5-hydroxy-6-metoxy-1,4-benzoquinol methylase
MSDATTQTSSAPTQDLARAQELHFSARAASWTNRYRLSPSFRARLEVVGRAIDDTLRDRAEARVLDFGGGTGVFSAVASRSASFTLCVDRSRQMLLEGMQDRASLADVIRSEGFAGSLGTVERIAGDDECVACLRATFDLILAIAVVEYFPDAVTLLVRLAQRLGQDGTLLITVPNPTSPVRIAQRVARPLLVRGRSGTGRLADQSFLELRPHDDDVPWKRAAAAAGLVVKQKTALPLGPSGIRRWFHPNLLLSLERADDHRG